MGNQGLHKRSQTDKGETFKRYAYKEWMQYQLNVIPSEYTCIVNIRCFYGKNNAFDYRSKGNDYNW